MPEQQKPPRTNLEEIRERLNKSEPVQVDPSGRLVERERKPGEEPPAEKTQLKPQRWFITPSKTDDAGAPRVWYRENPARLILEKRAMATRFPQFELHRDGNRLVWLGSLETDRLDKRYQVALYYPDDFPTSPPKVYPVEPTIAIYRDQKGGAMMHQFNDGSLCLFHPNERFFEVNTTAATIIAAAAVWLFAYEHWQETGQWVGPEAD